MEKKESISLSKRVETENVMTKTCYVFTCIESGIRRMNATELITFHINLKFLKIMSLLVERVKKGQLYWKANVLS